MRFGTAVGSDDINLIKDLKKMHKDKILDYIELYTKKDATVYQMMKWVYSGIPISFLQAEHDDTSGIDLESIKVSEFIFQNVEGIENVIYDAGYYLDELLETKREFPYFLPENMPYKTVFGVTTLSSSEDAQAFAGAFCLDISHAYITSCQLKHDFLDLLAQFLGHRPVHFHLTDTDGINDHLLMGKGHLDLNLIFPMLPKGATITVETDNLIKNRVESIRKDLEYVVAKYKNGRNHSSKTRK